jgi:hypothetical protein
VTVNPGGGSGRDEPPLDIQIPDDARELDRDVLAYHRELRARRRRSRLRRLTRPFAGQGTVVPLLASILAVCLVAGAMLSVATFSPATAPATPSRPPTTAASGQRSTALQSSPQTSAPASTPAASTPAASASGTGTSAGRASAGRASGNGTARPSGAANSSARSSPSASQIRPSTVGGP